MPNLSDEMNTWNTCLHLLAMRGFELELHFSDYTSDESPRSYCATRDGTRLIACNPVALAGLAALHEFHHPHSEEPHWWVIEGEDIHDAIAEKGLFDAFQEFWRKNPTGCRQFVREQQQLAALDPTTSLEDRLSVPLSYLQEKNLVE